MWLRPVQLLQSRWVHMYVLCLEGLVFSVSSILIGSFHLSIFSPTKFPKPWGDGLEGDIPFRTDGSKVSHSLSAVQLRASLFVSIYCRKKRLSWWLLLHLITVKPWRISVPPDSFTWSEENTFQFAMDIICVWDEMHRLRHFASVLTQTFVCWPSNVDGHCDMCAWLFLYNLRHPLLSSWSTKWLWHLDYEPIKFLL